MEAQDVPVWSKKYFIYFNRGFFEENGPAVRNIFIIY